MSKPAFVYISADLDRILHVDVTKEPDIAILREESERGKPLRIVLQYEFGTIKDAIARLKELGRLNSEELTQLIELSNPEWQDLLKDRGKVAASSPRPPDDPPGAGGGAPVPVPVPPSPRQGREAKAIPHD